MEPALISLAATIARVLQNVLDQSVKLVGRPLVFYRIPIYNNNNNNNNILLYFIYPMWLTIAATSVLFYIASIYSKHVVYIIGLNQPIVYCGWSRFGMAWPPGWGKYANTSLTGHFGSKQKLINYRLQGIRTHTASNAMYVFNVSKSPPYLIMLQSILSVLSRIFRAFPPQSHASLSDRLLCVSCIFKPIYWMRAVPSSASQFHPSNAKSPKTPKYIDQ